MDRICLVAERQTVAPSSAHRVNTQFRDVDEAIAMASMYTANHLGVRAIVSMTESGSTPQWMSRISSGIPIYALTKHEATRRKVTLYRGVYPVPFDSQSEHHYEVNKEIIDVLLSEGTVVDGDVIIITKGDLVGVHGGTNTMKILTIGES